MDEDTRPGYPPSMTIRVSSLRENLYSLLDGVLETGLPIEIEWRGKTLRIARSGSGLDNLRPRPYFLVDPEEIVHLDWSEEWSLRPT